jgi:hypothetical protein
MGTNDALSSNRLVIFFDFRSDNDIAYYRQDKTY